MYTFLAISCFLLDAFIVINKHQRIFWIYTYFMIPERRIVFGYDIND